MNILMFTNTFTPHVGGVARSVQQFAREFRAAGHQVLVVAPEFENTPENESDVVRIPAFQHFNGTDFSVAVPIPGFLDQAIDQFKPDVIHSHHPFLLGDTALRVSASRDLPVVFTHHTQYEQYTHYIPGDSEVMKRFVVELAIGYCNLCNAVVAPSETIRQRLIKLGVESEIVEIPTGVDVDHFGKGDGAAARTRCGISQTDFVVGHVGRLAPEKGLDFLSDSVADFIKQTPGAVFLVAGSGPSEKTIRESFEARDISDRLILLGALDRAELADVYAAMDVFAFASQSETQGMVLSEAMAASTPVVAVDASGVREVMRHQQNGLMLDTEDKADFIAALAQIEQMSTEQYDRLVEGAVDTAQSLSMQSTADQALELYSRLIEQQQAKGLARDGWSNAMRRLGEEWKIWSNVAEAAGSAVLGGKKVVS